MKQLIRILAMLLACIMLLGSVAFAAEDNPYRNMTDAELIAQFNIPDTWSRKALIFAVRNGLLQGKGGNNLARKANTTRAEMATILTRIAQTKTEADLSAFTDVPKSAWFYSAMAKVQAMGILANNGATTMRPKENITREEVFVSLARTFGIYGTSKQALYDFSDWQDVSSWAGPELSAMISKGYVNGSSGKLNPKKPITREELAQVLSNMLTNVSTSVGKSVTGQYAISSDTIAAGTKINGDLLLTNDVKYMTLENVTVTGRLILQGNNRLYLTLKNCSIGELVTCKKTTITCDGGVKLLTTLNECKFTGTANNIEAYALFILTSGSTANRFRIYGEGNKCTIGGQVTSYWVISDNIYTNGGGYVETVVVYRPGFDCHVSYGTWKDSYHRNMGDVEAVRQDAAWADAAHPNLTLKCKLIKMPAGKQDCVVTWTVNGKKIQSERMLLEDGCIVTCDVNCASMISSGKASVPVILDVVGEGKSYRYNGTINFEDPAKTEALTIRTQAIQATITNTTTFYNYFNVYSKEFSGANGTVAANTQVTILKISHATGVRMRLPDGRIGWAHFKDVHIIPGSYFTTTDYSKAAKEYYVNKLHSFSSSTGYLIWISLYTQHVNVFQGSKGNWKLIQSGVCASGANSTPTPVEDVQIYNKQTRWEYEAFYCHHITVFDETRAFHSRPTKYEGGIYNSAIGYPCSGGCVRLMDSLCIYIYDNIPVGTPVHIY